MKNLIGSIYTYTILLILAFAVSSCGGGGGAATTSSSPTTSQGKFIDAAVEGITYTSGSITGTTSADGSFSYQTGQSVTFSIGGITLGSVSGSSIVTPVQLVSGAVNETDPTVVNIVQFLLSIDDDNDPTNGIKISPAMVTAAAGLSNIDFTLAGFDTDSGVISAISTIKSAASIGYIGVYDQTLAQAHLNSSLFSVLSGTYTGTYAGSVNNGFGIDNGTWVIVIDASGDVVPAQSSVTSTTFGVTYPYGITGTVNTSGSTNVATGTAGSATWAGTINITTGAISGTWNDPAEPDNGSFSGSKN